MKLRQILTALLIGAAIPLLVTACASGPTFSTIQAKLPAVAAEKGRIYFYRESSPIGAGIQPSILLDGTPVGDSVPGGVFYVDAAPGNHVVSTVTEVDRKVTFTLAAGQVRYIRSSVGLGVLVYRVHPELVDPKVGAAEIRDLAYTGSNIK